MVFSSMEANGYSDDNTVFYSAHLHCAKSQMLSFIMILLTLYKQLIFFLLFGLTHQINVPYAISTVNITCEHTMLHKSQCKGRGV